MSNDNKILDFTITLYSNKLKIVKEVSCKPTELEKVIDELDKQASVPKRGDGHHGFYIEVEVRRHKDVNIKRTSRSSKRQSEPAARKASAVHSGGRGSADDSKSRGDNRSVRSGIRSGGDGVSGSKGRGGKAPEAEEVSRRAGARSERAVRAEYAQHDPNLSPEEKEALKKEAVKAEIAREAKRLKTNRKAREKYHAKKKGKANGSKARKTSS
jgi:hypothetical protein